MEGRSPRDFLFKILLLRQDLLNVFYGGKFFERLSIARRPPKGLY